jgi:cobalt-zinc-cadmium efflux system protein
MSRASRLLIVLGMNLVLLGALIVVGLRAHSLGVLAEGMDYLADAGAVVVSLLAIRVASRHPKAPAVAAFVNAGWLLVLSLSVGIASIQRLVTGSREVHGLPVLVVSSIAALTMLAGVLILRGDDDDHDVNLRAVILDTLGDAIAAAGVAVTGGVIYALHGAFWLDPAAAVVIAALVGFHACKLLAEVIGELRGVGDAQARF